MKLRILVLGLYIGVWLGLVLAVVGKPVECIGGKYDGWLVINMFLLLTTPTVLGYFIGKEIGEKNK